MQIQEACNEGDRCHFQAALMYCDEAPKGLNAPESSPRKRKNLNQDSQVVHAVFLDMSGAMAVTFWGKAAATMCSLVHAHSQADGSLKPMIVDMQKMRVVPLGRNQWNGNVLTRMSTLSSVESLAKDTGTSIAVLDEATSDNLKPGTVASPSNSVCLTDFKWLQAHGRPQANFRITLKGKVVDLQSIERTQNGHEKRIFNLVDDSGLWITVCAMFFNASAPGLQNYAAIIVYYGAGRAPIGSAKGMIYCYKDSLIVPTGKPSIMLTSPKREELVIFGTEKAGA